MKDQSSFNKARSSGSNRFRVYYDGLCPLCSREIDFYRKKDGQELIDWVDITREGFDAQAEGLDPEQVHRFFHVKDESGKIETGVDAFVQIWSRIPSLRKWKLLSMVPGVRPVMKVGYSVFARVRPLLPRRSRVDCPDGYCEIAVKERK